MADTFKQLQSQYFTLAGAGSSIGDTSVILSSLTTIDGTLITMAMIGSKGYFTIEAGNGVQEEAGTFTGITQNVNGTATLTGVSHQMFEDPYTETSGLTKSHAGGTQLIFSNTAGFYENFLRLGDDNTVNQTITFTKSPIVPTPTTDYQAATKKYIDDAVIAGGVDASSTVKGISKLSSDPSSPTNPIALNGEEVSATSGVSKVVRANASGKVATDYISDGTSSGLEAGSGNGTQVKIKTSGGLVRDTNGLSVGGVLPSTTDITSVINGYKNSNMFTLVASTNVRTSANTLRSTSSNTYVKLKEILLNDVPGIIKVRFDLYTQNSSYLAYGKIYKNGVAYGTERTTTSGVGQTFTEDLSFTTGDLIQIYVKTDAGGPNAGLVFFALEYDKQPVITTNTVNID